MTGLICFTLLGLSLLVIVEALSVWRKSSESRLKGLRSLFLDGSGVVESLLKKLSLFFKRVRNYVVVVVETHRVCEMKRWGARKYLLKILDRKRLFISFIN